MLARSWIQPAKARVTGAASERRGYDANERAYCIERKGDGVLKLAVAASTASPVVNPALVIRGWGEAGARLVLDGRRVARGRAFRFGHRKTLEGTDLVVFIEAQKEQPLEMLLEPLP